MLKTAVEEVERVGIPMKKLKKKTEWTEHSVEAYAACSCYCVCCCACGCAGIFQNRFKSDIPARVSSIISNGSITSHTNDASHSL